MPSGLLVYKVEAFPREGNLRVPLHLASARHMVVLVGIVFVLAFTAIELVPPPAVKGPVNEIVAITAAEYIIATGSKQPLVVACAPEEFQLAGVPDPTEYRG